MRKASDRLARLQRAKSKLPKDHKDKPKLDKTIAKLHQKIARQRQDFHFATAYWLFSKADVVFIEDLKLKNLIRRNKPKPDGKGSFLPNNQAQSSGMNKSWLDAGHFQFFKILEWVAWKLGKRVIKVNPWGTSQYCHACLDKVPKSLSDRWHSCPCGAELNRDENSGKLLKLLGLGLASIQTAPQIALPNPYTIKNYNIIIKTINKSLSPFRRAVRPCGIFNPFIPVALGAKERAPSKIYKTKKME